MKKVFRIILKCIAVLAIAIIAFLAIVFIVNVIGSKLEKDKIDSYGHTVTVDGKEMNVFIQGGGEETIVLLPGYGTASPALDFKILVDKLAPFYKVVVVEPFGYGLSDGTEKERSTDNIVSEIHEALQQLNIESFILMGHSIAGIYGMDYINKYPNEVTAFIGIDSSVPEQPGMDVKLPYNTFEFLKKSGLLRLVTKVSGDPYAEVGYDDYTREQLRYISNKNSYNDTTMNEMRLIATNFANAKQQQLAFPQELPVMLFVQAHNPTIPEWVPLHEDLVQNVENGIVVTLEGEHYLHHTRSQEIVDQFRAFMSEVE